MRSRVRAATPPGRRRAARERFCSLAQAVVRDGALRERRRRRRRPGVRALRAWRRRLPGSGARLHRLLPRARHSGALRERLSLHADRDRPRSPATPGSMPGSGAMSRLAVASTSRIASRAGAAALPAGGRARLSRRGARCAACVAAAAEKMDGASTVSGRRTRAARAMTVSASRMLLDHRAGVPVRFAHQRGRRPDQHVSQDHRVREAGRARAWCCMSAGNLAITQTV